jgi:transposase-like protein
VGKRPTGAPRNWRRPASAAKARWRQVADRARPKLPKLATLLDNAEEDVLAFIGVLCLAATCDWIKR